ncbi:alpha-hydroxy acid oxidase [Sphingomonas sp.]|uniref:alpha-hydroxy acid oxidase n=1 Tax=Sphingomonas sp. TaxID=28214 RepID=UPI002DD62D73|nr:alpha-hydroxy acid oxidase [Sphingomonas sp.]
MEHDWIDWRDVRDRAGRRLPRLLFDYVEGGGFDESTASRNRDALDRIDLPQRVLNDIDAIDTSCVLFGRRWSMPLMLAPVGFAGMMARRGEVQAARAAAAAGIPFVLSTFAICSIEEVVRGCGVAPWMQLYLLSDPNWLDAFLPRIADLGVDTIILTVDVPVPGVRFREARRPLRARPTIASHAARVADGLCHPRWLYDVYLRGRPHAFGNMPGGRPGQVVPVTPAALERLRSAWRGRLVVKGVIDPEDARRAVDLGADGVIVSNHGGRQLGGVRSTIEALGPVVEAVGGRVPVLMDGGIRGGMDIARAASRGAQACLTGRAWAHALAAGGEEEVRNLLRSWRDELAIVMRLGGRATLSDGS